MTVLLKGFFTAETQRRGEKLFDVAMFFSASQRLSGGF
jgi:hypothetical protein